MFHFRENRFWISFNCSNNYKITNVQSVCPLYRFQYVKVAFLNSYMGSFCPDVESRSSVVRNDIANDSIKENPRISRNEVLSFVIKSIETFTRIRYTDLFFNVSKRERRIKNVLKIRQTVRFLIVYVSWRGPTNARYVRNRKNIITTCQ